jgi:bacillithiol biosynthesis deacetylase BshB1
MEAVDILAFGAHPDDVELGCSGTLVKATANGKRVAVVDLTQGELGTRGNATTRLQEAATAAQLMGVVARENMAFRDGFFTNDEQHQRALIQKIRKYRPDVVLCNAETDRHIDHGRGSDLVAAACFLSGLSKIETEADGIPQLAWRPRYVFHYIQWNEVHPNFIVDISGHLDKKMEVVQAYASQFFSPNSKEKNTPISSKNFLDSVRYRAENYGRLIGTAAGEGFTTKQPLAIADINGWL